MWLRLGLIVGRVLLRLGIRLAPFIAIGLVGLFRRYRWPLYYRAKSLQPTKFSLSTVPLVLGAALCGLVLLGILLYVVAGALAPRA